MFFHRSRRVLTAWIACFAVLLGSLAPSISHAISAKQGELWVEICTAEGVKYVKFESSGSLDSSSQTLKSSSFEHCPFCSLQGHAPALLNSQPAPLLAMLPVASHPTLFYQSPRPLAIWLPAQSRAPPSLLA